MYQCSLRAAFIMSGGLYFSQQKQKQNHERLGRTIDTVFFTMAIIAVHLGVQMDLQYQSDVIKLSYTWLVMHWCERELVFPLTTLHGLNCVPSRYDALGRFGSSWNRSATPRAILKFCTVRSKLPVCIITVANENEIFSVLQKCFARQYGKKGQGKGLGK